MQFVFLLSLTMALTGCKHSPSQYIAPRVTGRVLDAQSRVPIPDVRVQRLGDHPPHSSNTPARGAEILAHSPAERTRADGTFSLASRSDLAFLRRVSWFSLTVTFSHPDYNEVTRYFSPTNATKTSSGEPWLDAGDVLLSRKDDK